MAVYEITYREWIRQIDIRLRPFMSAAERKILTNTMRKTLAIRKKEFRMHRLPPMGFPSEKEMHHEANRVVREFFLLRDRMLTKKVHEKAATPRDH